MISLRAAVTAAAVLCNACGQKLEEVVGKVPQRLEDHLWLHTDE